jgi:hypothetical protein
MASFTQGSIDFASKGPMALDPTGTALAVETSEQKILIAGCRTLVREPIGFGPGWPRGKESIQRKITPALSPICVLALHIDANLLAIGAPDGRVVVQDARTGNECHAPAIRMPRAPTALAFSRSGDFLAVGDSEGNVIVASIASGKEDGSDPLKFKFRMTVKSLAVSPVGPKVAIGAEDGRILCRSPKSDLKYQADGPVESIIFDREGGIIIGYGDGRIETRYSHAFLPPLKMPQGCGPIRAIGYDRWGKVRVIADGSSVFTFSPRGAAAIYPHGDKDLISLIASRIALLASAGFWMRTRRRMSDWWRDSRKYTFEYNFERQKELEAIAERRTRMLDDLKSLDGETKERIRPVIAATAEEVFDTYAFNVVLRNALKRPPFGPSALFAIVALLGIALSGISPFNDFRHLSSWSWITMIITFTGGAFLLRITGLLGVSGRVLRVLLFGFGFAIGFLGREIEDGIPHKADLIVKQFPVPRDPHVTFSVLRPVYLGDRYLIIAAAVIIVSRLLLNGIRGGSGRTTSRGLLLHSLLEVAHYAQLMNNDAGRASLHDRRYLVKRIKVAAGIASREWVSAHELGFKSTDAIVRNQGLAIAAAIQRWEHDATLGYARLPALASAFAIAVVNAADQDWSELSASSWRAPSIRSRARIIAKRGLALIMLLGVFIVFHFTGHPLPDLSLVISLVPEICHVSGLPMMVQ